MIPGEPVDTDEGGIDGAVDVDRIGVETKLCPGGREDFDLVDHDQGVVVVDGRRDRLAEERVDLLLCLPERSAPELVRVDLQVEHRDPERRGDWVAETPGECRLAGPRRSDQDGDPVQR